MDDRQGDQPGEMMGLVGNTPFDLSGRVAIVTGGAGQLGGEYSHALAGAGAHVLVADVRADAAMRVANEVRTATNGIATGVCMDVSSRESVQDAVRAIYLEHGRIDILVNNAALDPKFERQNAGDNTFSFEDYPLELWNQAVGVNLTGMFLCAQAVARPMLAGGGGVIVNISSTYGIVGPDQRMYEGKPGEARSWKPVAYSVTKSGVTGLTRYLATYWAGQNIRVNTLTPGGVFNDHDDEFTQRYASRTPMGRMAARSEYCGAMLFLASDASSYMTGANLVVDGGWTAW